MVEPEPTHVLVAVVVNARADVNTLAITGHLADSQAGELDLTAA